MSLESKALNWLLYVHGSHFAVRERHPRYNQGNPDVLGITKGRRLTEIEIKRSMSDFRANSSKRHIVNRDKDLGRQPYMFYFLVPHALTQKALLELPEWAGLMDDNTSESGKFLNVVKVAPINKAHRKLSIHECIRLMRKMANYCVSLESELAGWRDYSQPDWGMEYHI